MARRDEVLPHGQLAYPPWVCERGATKPGGLWPENPPGGGSFARGRRWLPPYSPLRGCSELAALATAKIPRRRPPANFKTGSKVFREFRSRRRRGARGRCWDRFFPG